MEFRYEYGGEVHTVHITEKPEGYEVRVGDHRYRVRGQAVDASTLDFWIDGQYRRARHAAQENERWLSLDGEQFHLTRILRRRKQHQSGEGKETLEATMPGQIISVNVEAGEVVERGQLLALMEAMKMELRVTAPHDGTIRRVLIEEGEAVERGQTLIEMGE